MDGQVLVRQLVDRDPAGLANLYESYAAPLHDYCTWLLGDRDRAGDALHDTLLIAAERAAQLRDVNRLRPWLYAIARNECLRTMRHDKRVAGPPAADQIVDEPDLDSGLRARQTADLVHQAVAALGDKEREVVLLALRHQLEITEIASALGVPTNHAHALVSRAKVQLEKAVTAVVLTRDPDCSELAAVVGGKPLTALLRKRVNRHVASCMRCSDAKRRRVSPAALLSAVPFIAVLWPVKARAMARVVDPQFVSYRQGLVNRAGPWRSDGFPAPTHRGGRVFALVGAVAIVALLGIAAAMLLRDDGDPVELRADSPADVAGVPTRTPKVTQTPSQPPTPSTSPSPAAEPSRTPASPPRQADPPRVAPPSAAPAATSAPPPPATSPPPVTASPMTSPSPTPMPRPTVTLSVTDITRDCGRWTASATASTTGDITGVDLHVSSREQPLALGRIGEGAFAGTAQGLPAGTVTFYAVATTTDGVTVRSNEVKLSHPGCID